MNESASRVRFQKVVGLTLLAMSFTAFLGGCASTPRTTTQAAPGVDIGSYNTFSYISPLGTDRSGYTSFLSKSLMSATRSTLEAKGYRYSEDAPKMLVNFNANVQQKTKVDSAIGAGVGMGPWGYRRGLYAGWGGYGYPGSVRQYDEGILTIDLVDPTMKEMIWEGVSQAKSYDASKWTEEDINSHVTAILAELPVAKGTQ